MITREQALKLIEEHIENKNTIKHMLELEAVMGALWEELGRRESKELGGTKEEYMIAGLLHDGDYCDSVPAKKQGIQIGKWAKGKGYDLPENVCHAMAAHNWANTKIAPKSLMDWSILSADSLTGLIIACALVLPSKKLADVSPEMILKKFNQPSFAGGTRRDDIKMCEEKLNLKLAEFIKISLQAIQTISNEIGL